MYDESYLSFEEARDFVHSLGLKKIGDWENYCNSGKKPPSLPPDPAVVYWENWEGWKDWLVGTDADTLRENYERLEKYMVDESQILMNDKNIHFLSFEEARDFVRSLELETERNWWDYASSGNKPSNIPFTPWKSYEKQWKGFDDWLGIKKDKPVNNFLPFEQAREYVTTLGLKSHVDWVQFNRSGKRPPYIPSTPNHTYKEKWKGWGDWLGTGRIDTRKIEYLTFEESRDFVRKLGLKNYKQWIGFCKSGNKPSNIPRYPQIKYSREWKGWKDWFKDSGISNIITDYATLEDETTRSLDIAIKDLSSKHLSFEQARAYSRSLGLKSYKEWKKFTVSGTRPSNIPPNPHYVYREKWKGYVDWLGTGRIRSSRFLSFEQARTYSRSLGLKSYKEWKTFCVSEKKPSNIPTNPLQTYREKWKGYGDWLGTGRIRSGNSRPFEQARKYARSLDISNLREWREFCKSGKKPSDIPVDPSKTYWKEWISWTDWFGQVFLPFEEARDIVRMFRLNNATEWEKFCKSGKKPHNIPEDPWRVYSMQWKNMNDWLRFGKIPPAKIEYLPFEEARKYVRSLKLEHSWYGFCISGRKPRNIPPNPEGTYPDKWRGWDDWLGIK